MEPQYKSDTLLLLESNCCSLGARDRESAALRAQAKWAECMQTEIRMLVQSSDVSVCVLSLRQLQMRERQ